MSVIPFVSSYSAAKRAEWIDALQAHLGGHTVMDYADCDEHCKKTAEVAVIADPDPQHLLQLKNLHWMQSLWAGVEKILATEQLAHIPLVRLVDPGLTERMSEAALAWSLYLHRDMPVYRKQQCEKVWQAQELVCASDRCIAVLGCGELGLAAAQRLQQNHFNVSAWSRTARNLSVTHYHGADGLCDILSVADIIVCLLPLTEQTKHILNARTLGWVKPGGAIINFGRGPLIDTGALLEALDSGHLSHAVLDVFDIEPLPSPSQLWSHPDITLLPHISAQTNIKTASKVAANNLLQWFNKGKVPPFVDRKIGY